MNKTAEVIIIGGGVIGCAAAYYLASRQVKVLVLEKEEIGVGGSSRNGGGVRQSARDPREMPFAIHGVTNLWPTLSETLGAEVEYRQYGNLRLAKTPAHLTILEKIVEQGQSFGLDVKMITGSEVKALCPQASDEVIGASYCKTDGHANPMRTTLAFYRKARALGAEFITGEAVERILLQKGSVAGVATASASYHAPTVILAAGLGSRPIANGIGLDIPMQKVLLEALITEAQPVQFPMMIGTAASDFYGHQTDHGSFVFGGMTGLEPFESEKDTPITKSITAPSICRAILGYFPNLAQANIIRTWAGFLDEMADHVPVMGRVDEVPGLIMACGFSGHGFGISPAVGEALSQVVIDGESKLSMAAFRYDRFKPRI